MKKIFTFQFVSVFLMMLLPSIARAQGAFAGISAQQSGTQQIMSANSIPSLLSGMFTLALEIGAVLAVVRIAYAGYLYMGSDMWSNKTEARSVFSDAVVGLLLLLAVWLILNQINPDILNLNVFRSLTSPGGVPCNSTSGG